MSSRDPRFVAEHRGGLLPKEHHRALAGWGAACAEHVLPLLAAHTDDDRPARAIAVAREWQQAATSVGACQKAAVAAHACARSLTDPAAIAVARAAGHAVATAHMADHALGGAMYAIKAIRASGGSVEDERAWQLTQAPLELRQLVIEGLARKERRK